MRLEEVKELCYELAAEVKGVVRPHLGDPEARKMMGRGAGGDSTFAIDEVAESLVEKRLREIRELAYLSEDRGLVGEEEEASWVLVVDPIDGTRPAAAGFEACCVSIAAAPFRAGRAHTLGDVVFGLIEELKDRARFEAERGKGCRILIGDEETSVRLSENSDISTLFWTLGFRGRPALPLSLALEELMDRSSVDGGIFDLGSATYCITRLLTGQLDAYVDIGDRMLRDAPELEENFRAAGHGHVLNNSSYDLAAAALIASEAGVSIGDAFGKSIEDYPLLACGREGQLSCVAATSQGLFKNLISMVDAGIDRMKSHYGWT
jgi:myo-inositol-1(or 4)-monophosphatase